MTPLEVLVTKLADEGRLIEAGWVSLRDVVAPPDDRVEDMRLAFMAGAQHLFSSLVAIFDPDTGIATEEDFIRFDRLARELTIVYDDMMLDPRFRAAFNEKIK